MFAKYPVLLLVVQVLLLGFVQCRLKENGLCNFNGKTYGHLECRKSCRGVMDSLAGTCDDGLRCCNTVGTIVSQTDAEYGYCVFDEGIDELFECKKSCGELSHIPEGRCGAALQCCNRVHPYFGKEVTIAPDVLIKKAPTTKPPIPYIYQYIRAKINN